MQNLTLDSSNEVDIDPLVWVVTTVFDRFDRLSRYLECVENQSYKNLKIIIVDHGVKNVEEFLLFGDNVLVIKRQPNCGGPGR